MQAGEGRGYCYLCGSFIGAQLARHFKTKHNSNPQIEKLTEMSTSVEKRNELISLRRLGLAKFNHEFSADISICRTVEKKRQCKKCFNYFSSANFYRHRC